MLMHTMFMPLVLMVQHWISIETKEHYIYIYINVFWASKLEPLVSINAGNPESTMWMGCSTINHPFGGIPKSDFPAFILWIPNSMVVSINDGTPESSIWIACSTINHPFGGIPTIDFPACILWFPNNMVGSRNDATNIETYVSPTTKLYVVLSTYIYICKYNDRIGSQQCWQTKKEGTHNLATSNAGRPTINIYIHIYIKIC